MASPPAKRVKVGEASSDGGFLKLNYSTIIVKVDVTQLEKTANPLRSFNKDHPAVTAYKEMFLRSEYGDANQYISVALPGMEKSVLGALVKKLQDNEPENRNLHNRDDITSFAAAHIRNNGVVLVDGAHRCPALEDEEVRSVVPFPTAFLYYRKDFEPLTELDIQAIGRSLNRAASTVVPMSNQNRVQSFLAVIRSIAESTGDIARDDDEKAIIDRIRGKKEKPDIKDVLALCKGRNFFDRDERQERKYTQVALGIYKYKDKRDAVLAELDKMETRNINIICSSRVWVCSTDIEQIFVLQVIRKFYDHNTGKDVQRSEKESGELAGRAQEVWSALYDAAKSRNAEDSKYWELLAPERRRSTSMLSLFDHCVLWLSQCKKELLSDSEKFIMKAATLVRKISFTAKWPSVLPTVTMHEPSATQEQEQSGIAAQDEEAPDSDLQGEAPDILVEDEEDPLPWISPQEEEAATAQRRTTPLDQEAAPEEGQEEATSSAEHDLPQPKSISVFDEDASDDHLPDPNAPDPVLDELPASWASDKNAVKEIVDSHGFQVTHRSKTALAFKYPKVRGSGIIDLRRETAKQAGMEKMRWFCGTATTSKGKETTVRLMIDFVGRVSEIWPKWMMVPEKEEYTAEDDFLGHVPSVADEIEVDHTEYQLVLRRLGLRPPHAAFFSLCMRDLVILRRIVFAGVLSRTPILSQMATLIEDDMKRREVWTQVRNSLFQDARARLDSDGFTVFSSLLDQNVKHESWFTAPNMKLPDKEIGCPGEDNSESGVNRVHDLFSYFQDLLPTDDEFRQNSVPQVKFDIWASIRNTTRAFTGVLSETVPLTTSSHAVNQGLVEAGKEDGYKLLRGRTFIEIIVLMLVYHLRLRYKWFSGTNKEGPGLYSPDSGGRFIASTKRCTAEDAHIDYYHVKQICGVDEKGLYTKEIEHPGYFAIVAGSEGSYLWVAPGSHRIMLMEPKDLELTSKMSEMRLIKVLPWSVIIARGDVLHGGAGGMESSQKHCLRFRMYVSRENVTLADAINCHPGFKPCSADTELDDAELLRMI